VEGRVPLPLKYLQTCMNVGGGGGGGGSKALPLEAFGGGYPQRSNERQRGVAKAALRSGDSSEVNKILSERMRGVGGGGNHAS